MKKTWSIVILFWSFNIYAGDIDWKTTKQGIKYATIEKESKYLQIQLTLNLFKVDLQKFNINIADVYAAARQSNTTRYTLKTIMDVYDPVLAINGGYNNSFINPVPSGLVKIENKLYAKFATDKSDPQSGVICISKHEISVVKREEYKDEMCDSSLQAGPRLIEDNNKIGIDKTEKDKIYERSIACIINPNEIVFAQTSKASLYELAELFGANEALAIIKCSSVINLDGDESSGLLVKNNNDTLKYGTTTSLIASSIYIMKR